MASENAHILIVDDHRDIREPLADYFQKHGFRTSTAADGRAMDAVLKRASVDLIILDVLMPGENGFEICRRIRATTDLPVVLLTAVVEETDRIVGLELGADDYVTKPFNPRELLARVKTILRRFHSQPRAYGDPDSESILFGDWVLDVGQQRLSGREDDAEIALSTVEFRLLMAFLTHPKRVLSREQLLDKVANRTAQPFDRSIDNQVSRLRKKIDPDTRHPKLIKTVWGGGYMLIVDVVRA